MKFSLTTTPLTSLKSACIISGIYANKKLSPTTTALNKITNGLINKLIKRDNFTGQIGETLLINNVPDSAFERILLLGLGEEQILSAKSYRKMLKSAGKTLKQNKISNALSGLTDIEVTANDIQWKIRQNVELFNDSCYQFSELKSEKSPAINLQNMQIMVSANTLAEAELALKQGLAIAHGITFSKRLADLPGNICTPTYLAEQALKISKQCDNISVNILEKKDIEAAKMGAFLSVSRGSVQPPKLICIRYQGGNNTSKPYVLVGKGLTFDAGGISLKPSTNMDEMKYDMCGGACVLGTLQAVADMALNINVVGLIPSSENMPDGNANKPGDIVTSMSGQTIEVLNTDAEGRLILCDTLTYSKRYDPEVVIDLATLTGACLVALGRHPSALFSNDEELCTDLIKASKTSCDSLWRLPLWEEYQTQLKSNFADMANIGGREGGSITAACFLARYTKNLRWAHLDIAGTAWRTGSQKGATGRPVPLLTQYLINCANA